MGSERMPDLDLPALRAVIAGVREKIPGLVLASRDERHSTGMLYREAASDLTTLADACERLAEENERMREALVRVVAHTALPHHPRWDLLLGLLRNCARIASDAITPAPAGKGEG